MSNYDTHTDPPNGGILWIIGVLLVCVVVGSLVACVGIWVLHEIGRTAGW